MTTAACPPLRLRLRRLPASAASASASRPALCSSTAGWDTGDLPVELRASLHDDRFQAVQSDAGVLASKGLLHGACRVPDTTSRHQLDDEHERQHGAEERPSHGFGLRKRRLHGLVAVSASRTSRYVPNTLCRTTSSSGTPSSRCHRPRSTSGSTDPTASSSSTCITAQSGYEPVFQQSLGPIIKGRWVDVVLRTKWAKDSSGISRSGWTARKGSRGPGEPGEPQNVVYPMARLLPRQPQRERRHVHRRVQGRHELLVGRAVGP